MDGTRACIKIYPFSGNTTHSHKSVFHKHNKRRHGRVWRIENVEYRAECIQASVKSPLSVQVC